VARRLEHDLFGGLDLEDRLRLAVVEGLAIHLQRALGDDLEVPIATADEVQAVPRSSLDKARKP